MRDGQRPARPRAQERLRAVLILVDRDRDDLHALLLETSGHLVQERHLLHARRAPRGPDVDQHDLALERPEVDLAAALEALDDDRRHRPADLAALVALLLARGLGVPARGIRGCTPAGHGQGEGAGQPGDAKDAATISHWLLLQAQGDGQGARRQRIASRPRCLAFMADGGTYLSRDISRPPRDIS